MSKEYLELHALHFNEDKYFFPSLHKKIYFPSIFSDETFNLQLILQYKQIRFVYLQFTLQFSHFPNIVPILIY